MKKNTYKLLAGVLGFSLILGTAGAVTAAVETKNSDKAAASYEKAELETASSDSVYVLADSNGNAERIILDDLSEVSAESSTPVSVTVKYYLDGREISPSELNGKSGHVVIRYDYINNSVRKVTVNDKSVDMTVPYTVATAVVLDGERFSNVTVNAGKIVDDGDRYAVVGVAFPGLKENLAVSDDKIKIPEYTEIEADVNNFRLDIAYTLCSGSMFATMDIDADGISEGISEKMATLTGAMTQLVTGSEQLAEGSGALNTGIVAYTNGVSQVADGLNQIDANSAALQNGAKTVFESLLATADSSLKAAGIETASLTIDNYEQVLTAVMSTLTPESVEAQARKNVEATLRAAGTYTEEQIQAYTEAYLQKEEMQTQIAQGKAQAEAGRSKLEGLLTQLKGYQVFYDGVVGYTNGVSQVTAGAAQINASSNALVEGAGKVAAGSLALNEGLNQLNTEGIEKIVNILDGENLMRAKAMLELAKEENSTKSYVYKLESIR